MAYCQGKLYLRKKILKEFGKLLVIDSNTFEVEGEIALCCDEVMKFLKSNSINKNFPLISVKGKEGAKDKLGVIMARLVEKDKEAVLGRFDGGDVARQRLKLAAQTFSVFAACSNKIRFHGSWLRWPRPNVGSHW